MERYFALASAVILSAVAACGGREAPSPEPDWAAGVPRRTLEVVDSIGVELGDSNYVFGQIAAVEWTPSGEIAVLDSKRCLVSFYSPDGTYLRSVGRNGSGPGEFLLPSAISFAPGGSFAVADAMAQRLSVFDPAGNYLRAVEGFFPTPPVMLDFVDDSSYVGFKPEFEQTEEGMFMGFSLGRWQIDSITPSVVYFSDMAPFDPADMASSFSENMFSYTTTPDGTVFRAPMTADSYTVEVYSPEGPLVLTIERSYTPVAKTEQEIEDEKTFVEARMAAGGAPAGMMSWEPDPYKFSIAGIRADHEGNVWVTRGWTAGAVFDVFDPAGELLYTVDIARDSTDWWQVVPGEQGFLAFNANPGDWSRLYVLEMR